MTIRSHIVIFFSFFFFIGCNNDGLFGHSKTKEEARKAAPKVIEFTPNKNNFLLLDGTKMQVDTAWAEVSFTYKDGKKMFDSTYGYNFAIPYKREDPESFLSILVLRIQLIEYLQMVEKKMYVNYIQEFYMIK